MRFAAETLETSLLQEQGGTKYLRFGRSEAFNVGDGTPSSVGVCASMFATLLSTAINTNARLSHALQ